MLILLPNTFTRSTISLHSFVNRSIACMLRADCFVRVLHTFYTLYLRASPLHESTVERRSLSHDRSALYSLSLLCVLGYSDCTSHTTTLVPGIVFQNSQCHGFRLSDFDLLTSSTLTSASLSPPSLAIIISAVAPFPTMIKVAVLLTSPTCTVKGKPPTLRFFFSYF